MVLGRRDNCSDEMVEPALGHLEDEKLGSAAGTDGKQARLIVRHELDVDRETAFVDELAAKPLVEDVLDGMGLTMILDREPHGVRRHQEALEGVSIADRFPIRESLPSSGRNRDQRG